MPKNHSFRRKQRCQQYITAKVWLGLMPRASEHVCCWCQAQVARVYHHMDYDYPDMVIPVCFGCHAAIHRRK
jgi:hypothetical protein